MAKYDKNNNVIWKEELGHIDLKDLCDETQYIYVSFGENEVISSKKMILAVSVDSVEETKFLESIIQTFYSYKYLIKYMGVYNQPILKVCEEFLNIKKTQNIFDENIFRIVFSPLIIDVLEELGYEDIYEISRSEEESQKGFVVSWSLFIMCITNTWEEALNYIYNKEMQ